MVLLHVFFFFKQKTAYEMRISDWSSDVCSSDLLDDADLARHRAGRVEVARGLAEQQVAGLVGLPGLDQRDVGDQCGLEHVMAAVDLTRLLALGDDGAV